MSWVKDVVIPVENGKEAFEIIKTIQGEQMSEDRNYKTLEYMTITFSEH